MRTVPKRITLTAQNFDTAIRYDRVIELLRPEYRSDLALLEVGSGSGGITEFLEHPVTGVDPSFQRTADRTNPLLTQVQGRADAIPLPDDSFDAVITLEMVEHLPPETRSPSFAEMLRVLKPGGVLIATFPEGPAAAKYDRKINHIFRKRYGDDHPWVIEHIRNGVPRAAEIRSLIQTTGIPAEAITIQHQLWGPAWYLMQLAFGVYGDSPKLRRLGLHSPLFLKTAFAILKRFNFGQAYRAIVIVRKPSH